MQSAQLAPAQSPLPTAPAAPHTPAISSRPDPSHPFAAPVRVRRNLHGPSANQQTVHLELSLAGSEITYAPGDTLGVPPRNSASYVDELLAALRLAPDVAVTVDGTERPLAQVLRERCEVTTITRSFLRAYAAATGHAELAALADRAMTEAFRATCGGREIIDLVVRYPPAGLAPQSFVGMLRRLQPRRYSLSSSLLAHPDAAHLLVGLTRYVSHGREREGVCSGYLCERLGEHEPLPVFLWPNPSFRLPADGDARIIMVGPGTGVAPFRAFVEERAALGCRGRNWLFYGARHAATDFLYGDEWQRYYRSGLLSRLDLAFSRDQAEKVYVQHRMREAARDLYAWLEAGAHVYVCGDASRMAPAVHEALLDIVAQESGKGREAAEVYVAALRASRRYQRDVY
jgi:sulfite reductase (NADPH) flavoprotein alpha-component